MTKGTVTYFNDYRGWGIISGSGVQKDIYVHYTAIKQDGYKTLQTGQEVSFELMQSENGLQAMEVYPE